MADHQKIHPILQDAEATQNPTAPLVQRSMVQSEKGEPLNDHHPLPIRRTFPLQYSSPPKRRCSCCKCICWTVSLVLLLTIVLGITVGSLYLVFRPKLPSYSVDSLKVTQFNLSENNSIYANFEVTITARNPNKKIGIYYVGGSHISAWYSDTKLCEGSLPVFYQSYHNITVLNLPLSGQTQNATGLLRSLQEQLQQTGDIPLNLRVRQPVRIRFGKLKLIRVRFLVKCRLMVDGLSATQEIRIKNNNCKFRFMF